MNQPISEAIIHVITAGAGQPQVIYRYAGDSHLLVEYGEIVLDLNLRFRVHSLMQTIQEMHIDGLMEMVPGVRSLLIKYNGLKLHLSKLLNILKLVEKNLTPVEEVEVSSRVVYLPIAFHDQWTRQAILKYSQTVRAEAPYLPDNVEFVARCNGLENIGKVLSFLVASQHLVVGLGDVYLGAPCAVPLDPRYRLVVPKYNPARMYTPEGAIGIGGAYICIYPMESPGGYQLVGRTLPIWNTSQTIEIFSKAPWLLRFFDRIQFQLVTEEELLQMREGLLDGHHSLRIEEGIFSVRKYNDYLKSVQKEAGALRIKQQEEAARWTKGY